MANVYAKTQVKQNTTKLKKTTKGNKNTTKSTENVSVNNTVERTDGMSDHGASKNLRNSNISVSSAKDIDSNSYKSILHSHNIFDRNEIDLFNKTYRFGLFNPYGAVTTTKEFLFFTKPDLNIIKRDDTTGVLVGQNILTDYLSNLPYWKDLIKNKKRIIKLLQLSADPTDNFNHLLQNQVISNLEVRSLSAQTVETPTNMYGVGFSYRGSSEASDDNIDFSLEFKDGKWLDVYHYFKTYEEYETLKHHGSIRPWKYYIENKIIHDQFSIYKFLVDEDMETILYWGKYYGVMPMSLPRDVFSNANFDSGISYSVDFKAAFFEDMKPEIIGDFNAISKEYYDSLPYEIDIYNNIFGRTDNRPAKAAYIEKVKSTYSPNGYVYKLKWKGSDKL